MHLTLRAVAVMIGAGVLLTAASAAPVTAAPLPVCSPANSVVSLRTGLAGTGHVGYLIHVQNESARSCSTSGYPRVKHFGADGRMLSSATNSTRGFLGGLEHGRVPDLVLAPGEEATALVESIDVSPSPGCASLATAATVKIDLPGAHDPVLYPLGFASCPAVSVHPLLAGASGSSDGTAGR